MRSVIRVMNELKEQGLIKDYAIGGAVAALRWTEPFLTQDLDIFVVLEREVDASGLIVLTPIYEYLRNQGYVWKGHWIMIEGIPVDIFPADPLEREAIAEAVEVEYEGITTKVMTPEYLIALFLRANRAKDKGKIALLLEQAEVDMEKLVGILSRYGLTERFEAWKEGRDG